MWCCVVVVVTSITSLSAVKDCSTISSLSRSSRVRCLHQDSSVYIRVCIMMIRECIGISGRVNNQVDK